MPISRNKVRDTFGVLSARQATSDSFARFPQIRETQDFRGKLDMSYYRDDYDGGRKGGYNNGSPNAGADAGGPNKTKLVQEQVDEVVNIMQQNIDKVMERGEKLDDLHNKTEDLQQSSSQFKRNASTLRKKMWWKDMKLKLLIAAVIIIILVIIIVSIVASR